jgi:hypothetical protein
MDIHIGSKSKPYGNINLNASYNNPPYNQSASNPVSHHNDKTDDTNQEENDKQKIDVNEQHNTNENEENTNSIAEKNNDKKKNKFNNTEKEKYYYKEKDNTQNVTDKNNNEKINFTIDGNKKIGHIDDTNRDINTESTESTTDIYTNNNPSPDLNKKDINDDSIIPIEVQNLNTLKTPFNPYQKETEFYNTTSHHNDNTLPENTPVTIPEITRYNYNRNQITDQDLRIRHTPNQNNTNKHLIDLNTPLQSFYPQNRSATHQFLQQKEVYPFNQNHKFNTPPLGVQLFQLNNDYSYMNSHTQNHETETPIFINPNQITQTPLGTSNEIKLSPELETLTSVIVSQHSALKAHLEI